MEKEDFKILYSMLSDKSTKEAFEDSIKNIFKTLANNQNYEYFDDRFINSDARILRAKFYNGSSEKHIIIKNKLKNIVIVPGSNIRLPYNGNRNTEECRMAFHNMLMKSIKSVLRKNKIENYINEK